MRESARTYGRMAPCVSKRVCLWGVCSGNTRNSTSGKTLLTEAGGIDLAVPRDRTGSFSPQIVKSPGERSLEPFKATTAN